MDITKLQTIPTDLNNLKSQINKLNIYKLKTVLIDLKKLSNVADNDIVKKTSYNMLVSKLDVKESNVPAQLDLFINHRLILINKIWKKDQKSW